MQLIIVLIANEGNFWQLMAAAVVVSAAVAVAVAAAVALLFLLFLLLLSERTSRVGHFLLYHCVMI